MLISSNSFVETNLVRFLLYDFRYECIIRTENGRKSPSAVCSNNQNFCLLVVLISRLLENDHVRFGVSFKKICSFFRLNFKFGIHEYSQNVLSPEVNCEVIWRIMKKLAQLSLVSTKPCILVLNPLKH